MNTRVAYTIFVGVVALTRLCELAVSSRNARRLRRRGGVESGAGHYPWMVGLHAALLGACPLEVWLLDRPWIPPLAASMIVLVAGATALRWWAVATLGERWTTRVIVLPRAPLVKRGPYRWLRHPNYLAVVVEVAALPLVHTAWLVAVVFGAANAALLRERVRVEEAALGRAA